MRYQGLWTPSVTDSVNFQLGTGDTKTTIGPSDYKKRHWKNKYQHFNWKRIANEWSDIELVLYHNEIDFVDNEDVWTVKTVLDAFDFNEDGIYENEGFDYPSEVQKLLVQHPQNEDVIIVSPTYAHFSDQIGRAHV